jgi:hypothetical protein
MQSYTPSDAINALVGFASSHAAAHSADPAVQNVFETMRTTARAALRVAVIAEMDRIGAFSTFAELTALAEQWCDAAIADYLAKN